MRACYVLHATSGASHSASCRVPPPCASQHGNPPRLPPFPCTAWSIRGAAAPSKFWLLEASKTAISSLGYASTARTSQRSHWRGPGEPGRSVACARSLRTRNVCGLSGKGGTNLEQPPHRHDPYDALYKRYTGCFGRMPITERGLGICWGRADLRLFLSGRKLVPGVEVGH